MKCPLCSNEMENGFLGGDPYLSWFPESGSSSRLSWLSKLLIAGSQKLYAFRCSSCGKVELATEVTQVSE